MKLQRVVGTVQYCMLKNIIHNNFDIKVDYIKWNVSFCNADLIALYVFLSIAYSQIVLSNFEKIEFISYIQNT